MKKNKTIAYMLAATLLVGGTFLGTKALFEDKVDVAGELAISTGDVDIEIVNDTNWILDRNGNEFAYGTSVNGETGYETDGDVDSSFSNNFANNIKPGDKLTKKITIKNVGTLIANVDLTKNNQIDLGILNGFLRLEETLEEGKDTDKITMNPGEVKTVILTISADGEGLHNAEESYNKDSIEEATINLTGAWNLNATQKTSADEE